VQERITVSRRSRGRGQALVEFALIIPIFLAVLLGLMEGAYYAFTLNSLDRAVQEGGRHAAIVPPPIGTGAATITAVQIRVSDSATGLTVTPSSVSVSVNGCATAACFTARTTGDRVRVAFTYSHTPVTAAVFSGSASFPLDFQTEYTVE
jgi:Flp pilus assembly protein TadG